MDGISRPLACIQLHAKSANLIMPDRNLEITEMHISARDSDKLRHLSNKFRIIHNTCI